MKKSITDMWKEATGKDVVVVDIDDPNMEETIVQILGKLHAFNRLDEKAVETMSILSGLDCKELCRKHGIVYTVPQTDENKQRK